MWADYKKPSKGAAYIGYPVQLIANKRVVRDELLGWNSILKQSQGSGSPNVIQISNQPTASPNAFTASKPLPTSPPLSVINEPMSGDMNEASDHSNMYEC